MRYLQSRLRQPMRYLNRSLVLKASALCLVMSGLALAGCPDSQSEFDEFLDKSEPFRVVPTAGECLGPVDLSGTYVMGAAVVVDPVKPLRFKLQLTVDLAAGKIDGSLQAVAVPPNNGATAPGTLVGEVYTVSADLDRDDGSFSLDFGSIVVPVEANPILPAPVTAAFALEGCTSTPTASCGIIVGDITSPAAIPLAGSTWAITPLPDGADPFTLELATACPE